MRGEAGQQEVVGEKPRPCGSRASEPGQQRQSFGELNWVLA